jgi:DNA-binding MarR family transcriptional regulator
LNDTDTYSVLSQAIKNGVASLQGDSKTIKAGIAAIQQGQNRQNQGHDLQKHYETMEWLSPDSFAAQQSDLITRKQADTGQWFLDSPEFTEWVNGTSQTLFCPGIPGAGKTMMAAIAVDYLQNAIQTTDIGVAYLYCNYKRQADQTAPDLVAAIIKQLVQDRPSIAQSLSILYERHRVRGTRPPLGELSSVLHSVLANYSKVYVVLDALDECPEQNRTRNLLLEICRNLQRQTGLRLMVTSRQISDILEEFEDAPLIEVRANNSDLKRFVMGNVDRFAKFVRLNTDLQDLVQNRVIEAADGM